MMIYFYHNEQEGHVMTAPAPTGHDLAAIDAPDFTLDVNAYAWAIDETVRRGLFEWKGGVLQVADTYGVWNAFDPV